VKCFLGRKGKGGEGKKKKGHGGKKKWGGKQLGPKRGFDAKKRKKNPKKMGFGGSGLE